ELDGELSAIQTRIDRLLDALADGSVPRDEVAARLNAEKTRKDALTNERARLSGMLIVADLDTEKIKADLHDKVRDVKGLLGRQVPQARQMLRKLLADKIDIEPVGSGRQRGSKSRGGAGRAGSRGGRTDGRHRNDGAAAAAGVGAPGPSGARRA